MIKLDERKNQQLEIALSKTLSNRETLATDIKTEDGNEDEEENVLSNDRASTTAATSQALVDIAQQWRQEEEILQKRLSIQIEKKHYDDYIGKLSQQLIESQREFVVVKMEKVLQPNSITNFTTTSLFFLLYSISFCYLN